MPTREAELAAARHRVVNTEARIARQLSMIAESERSDPLAAEKARRLIEAMRRTLASAVAHRDLLELKLR